MSTEQPEQDERPTAELKDLAGTPFQQEMRKLARISPRAAILESFSRLEDLLRRELTDLRAIAGEAVGRPVTVRTLVRLAEDRGLLTSQERWAIEDLIPLKNAVADGESGDLDQERARNLAELTRQIMIAVLLARGKNIVNSDTPQL